MDPVTTSLIVQPVALGVATALVGRAVARKKLSAAKMAWLDTFVPLAKEVCAQYGVPYQVCVAQAALESGWGAKAPGFNYFGLKGGGTEGSQKFKTHEDANGPLVTQSFARFANMRDGIEGYCKAMQKGGYDKNGQRGAFAIAMKRFPKDPAKFITWVWSQGYAPGLTYPAIIIGVMRTVYRATGNEDFNLKMTLELQAVVGKIGAQPKGKARAAEADRLLPSMAGLAGFSGLSGGVMGRAASPAGASGLAGGLAVVPRNGGFSGAQGFTGKVSRFTDLSGGQVLHAQGSDFRLDDAGNVLRYPVDHYFLPALGALTDIDSGTAKGDEAVPASLGAKALEDEVSPLWWITPAAVAGLGLFLYQWHRHKKAQERLA